MAVSTKLAVTGLFAALTNPGMAQMTLVEADGFVSALGDYCIGSRCSADSDYVDFFLPTRGQAVFVDHFVPGTGTGGSAFSFTQSSGGTGCGASISFVQQDDAWITNECGGSPCATSTGAEGVSSMTMFFDVSFRRCAWYSLSYTVILRTPKSHARGEFRYGVGLVAGWIVSTSDEGLFSGALEDFAHCGEFSLSADSRAFQGGVGNDSTNITGVSNLSLVECIADWDCDFDTDSEDFFAYLDDFSLGIADADLDGDGDWDSDDYFIYLGAFNAGPAGCGCN